MSKQSRRLALLLLTGSVVVHFVGIASATAQTPYALRHTLFNPSPGAGSYDYFGMTVALSGTRLVVGAPYDDTRAENAGSVHVFDLAGAAPASTSIRLTNPRPADLGPFGSTVAISGNRLVVGDARDVTTTYVEPDYGSSSGSAHIYDLASATPSVSIFKFTNPKKFSSDGFGGAVAISGSLVVVGAPLARTAAQKTGGAYVFDVTRTNRNVPIATLNNPNPAKENEFGVVVAISGSRVVVGSPATGPIAPSAGSVYVYDLASATPGTPVVTLTNPAPVATHTNPVWHNAFGYAVAISNMRVVVGASMDGSGPFLSGRAYIYNLAGATPAVPEAVLDKPGPMSEGRFGVSVAISDTRVVVGAMDDPAVGFFAGSAYVFDLADVTPTAPLARLTKPNPMSQDHFGGAVAIDGCSIAIGVPNDDTIALEQGAAYVFTVGPTLRIAPAAPGLATLSWTPATSSGFALQYADALAPTNWFNALSGETNPVTLSLTNSARFYRLFQP